MSKIQKQHESDVERIQEQIRLAKEPLSLAKRSLQSNTTRSSEYKKRSLKLPVDSLNRILSIDHKRLTAVVEPRVSMQMLAEATYKEGLIPRVVPEFKGITVGGAIMGCGGESSSHRVGLFHNNCSYFDILLGDGSLVRATPNEHADLFYGSVGSYGTLGVLVAAEIALEEAKPYVSVEMHVCRSGEDAVKKIDLLMHKELPPEYLEGVVFSKDFAIVLEGRKSDRQEGCLLKDGPLSPWYYQFIKEGCATFSMPLLDYLFRYDRGAFWMGSYVFSFPILKKLFCEGIFKLQKPKPLTLSERELFSQPANPGAFLRALTYPFSASQPLYSLLHSCEEWVQERFMIQDFTLPVASCSSFLATVEEQCPIYPLWLCPVKGETGPTLFAPHKLNGSNSINVGVYGVPRQASALAMLEKRLHELGGLKWLYTNSEYTPEQFWSIYPESEYRALRKKYQAEDAWLSIESKVLSK